MLIELESLESTGSLENILSYSPGLSVTTYPFTIHCSVQQLIFFRLANSVSIGNRETCPRRLQAACTADALHLTYPATSKSAWNQQSLKFIEGHVTLTSK